MSNNLLAEEVPITLLVAVPLQGPSHRCPFPHVPDGNFEEPSVCVLLDVDVDREMGVDVTHLVKETLRNSDYQVVDKGFDCS